MPRYFVACKLESTAKDDRSADYQKLKSLLEVVLGGIRITDYWWVLHYEKKYAHMLRDDIVKNNGKGWGKHDKLIVINLDMSNDVCPDPNIQPSELEKFLNDLNAPHDIERLGIKEV